MLENTEGAIKNGQSRETISFKTNKHVACKINFDSKILLACTNIFEEKHFF